jgi:Mur ligase family, catalytic domain
MMANDQVGRREASCNETSMRRGGQFHGRGGRSRGGAHLIGIGGAGMDGVARLLLSHGVAVSGSDTVDSASVRLLRELGAHVFIGHDPANLPDGEATVVITTAIRRTVTASSATSRPPWFNSPEAPALTRLLSRAPA